jgi:hypothetical protein
MKFIAHRGNTNGVQPSWENTLDYLKFAYHDKGYDVECDLLSHRGMLYFGHDEPQEVADIGFLQQPGVWCHAKSIEALELLLHLRTRCFWHETDTVTLTNDGYIWCYPGVFPRHKRAVWLDLENIQLPEDTTGIYGICGDKI